MAWCSELMTFLSLVLDESLLHLERKWLLWYKICCRQLKEHLETWYSIVQQVWQDVTREKVPLSGSFVILCLLSSVIRTWMIGAGFLCLALDKTLPYTTKTSWSRSTPMEILHGCIQQRSAASVKLTSKISHLTLSNVNWSLDAGRTLVVRWVYWWYTPLTLFQLDSSVTKLVHFLSSG